MSVKFQRTVIQYVIGTINSCGKMIELEIKNIYINQIYMGNTWCYPIIAIGRGKSSSTYNKNVQNNGIYFCNRWKTNQFEIGFIINP